MCDESASRCCNPRVPAQRELPAPARQRGRMTAAELQLLSSDEEPQVKKRRVLPVRSPSPDLAKTPERLKRLRTELESALGSMKLDSKTGSPISIQDSPVQPSSSKGAAPVG